MAIAVAAFVNARALRFKASPRRNIYQIGMLRIGIDEMPPSRSRADCYCAPTFLAANIAHFADSRLGTSGIDKLRFIVSRTVRCGDLPGRLISDGFKWQASS